MSLRECVTGCSTGHPDNQRETWSQVRVCDLCEEHIEPEDNYLECAKCGEVCTACLYSFGTDLQRYPSRHDEEHWDEEVQP